MFQSLESAPMGPSRGISTETGEARRAEMRVVLKPATHGGYRDLRKNPRRGVRNLDSQR